MVLLDEQDGFSILETLVVITILGLLVSFTVSFFNMFYDNPVYLMKDEAFRAAAEEIDRTLLNRSVTDTIYHYDNLVVKRTVEEKKFYFLAVVNVTYKGSGKPSPRGFDQLLRRIPMIELKAVMKK